MPPTGICDLLAPWISAQRWFASKANAPQLRRIGGWDLPSADARVTTHLIMDHSGAQPTLYQVPTTLRLEQLPDSDESLIGTFEDEHGRVGYLYDGPHDSAYREAVMQMIVDGADAVPDGAEAEGLRFDADAQDIEIVGSRVLSGEQSNTSMIYDLAGPEGTRGVILKVFRTLHHGENPDVVLEAAIARAGSTHVPRPVGAIAGSWEDVGRAEGRAWGHLACAQEFLAGSEDGWRLALREASAGNDFTDRAFSLGAVTAEIHTTLAEVTPTQPATDADVGRTLASFERRLEMAVREVPAVAEFREAIERLYSAVSQAPWPPLQRIHGDYHLGQVLVTPEDRWVVLDFEGEPLRPMTERSSPDFAVRDVAGMLRSFDYVAGSLGSTGEAEEWARACRRAFLDGYIERAGYDLRENRILLDAFEVDKALYEAVYEARNRPDWVAIPIAALQRLAERSRSTLG